jgi:hypothetical protein
VRLKEIGTGILISEWPQAPQGAHWEFLGFAWCPCGCKAEMAVYELLNGKPDAIVEDLPASADRPRGGDEHIRSVYPFGPLA